MFQFKHVSVLLCFAGVLASCKFRDFNRSTIKADETTAIGCENAWEVNASQFESELKKPDVMTFLEDVSSLPEAQKASSMLNVAPSEIKFWILSTLTPLSMSFCGFQKSGTLRHGAVALKAFMQSVFLSMDSSTIEKDKLLLHMNFRNREFEDVSVFPDIAMLRLAAMRSGVDSGLFRVSGNGDDVPITAEQKTIYEASELKDLLSFESTDPIKEASGQTSPRFLINYIPLLEMFSQSGKPGALARWQHSITALANQPLPEFKIGISMAFRQCIAIHPFDDANGRSCRVWMAGAMARRGIRFPIMWNGVDIALPINEWQTRWLKAIEAHESIVK